MSNDDMVTKRDARELAIRYDAFNEALADWARNPKDRVAGNHLSVWARMLHEKQEEMGIVVASDPIKWLKHIDEWSE